MLHRRTTVTTTGRGPTCPTAAQEVQPVEPVEVRTGRPDGGGPPEQVLRRGRLWLVQHADRLDSGARQSERWAVTAGEGAHGRLETFELVRLVSGVWQLHEDGAAPGACPCG